MNQPVTIGFQPYEFEGGHVTYTPTASTGIVVPAGANALLIQAVGQNIRIKFDANAPSPTSGFQLRAGDPPILIVLHEGQFFYAISEVAGGTLEVQACSQAS